MDQKISIKIAGRTFNLTASSPEQEQIIRLAADAVDKRLAAFTRANPGKTMSELMSMVALNECFNRICAQRETEALKSEAERLGKDMADYLAGTER